MGGCAREKVTSRTVLRVRALRFSPAGSVNSAGGALRMVHGAWGLLPSRPVHTRVAWLVLLSVFVCFCFFLSAQSKSLVQGIRSNHLHSREQDCQDPNECREGRTPD